MSLKRKHPYTIEEYLAVDRRSLSKNEFINHEIIAMVGASQDHNIINGNIFASLHFQLKKRDCKVFQNDMRTEVSKEGDFYYPDIVVVCGEAKYRADTEMDTLQNPILIMEVLSKSTESFDKGAKSEKYRTINSLQEYILIAQNSAQVTQIVRQPDNRWRLSEINDISATIVFPAINCSITLEDIYDKVKLTY